MTSTTGARFHTDSISKKIKALPSPLLSFLPRSTCEMEDVGSGIGGSIFEGQTHVKSWAYIGTGWAAFVDRDHAVIEIF